MKESCHTYEWVMSHIWMSHVTHMDESCHTYERVMSHIWIRHFIQGYATARVTSHIWIRHGFFECAMSPMCHRINVSFRTHVCVVALRGTPLHESRLICEYVMYSINESCHIRVISCACHVAHVNASRPLGARRCMSRVTYMHTSYPPWMSHVTYVYLMSVSRRTCVYVMAPRGTSLHESRHIYGCVISSMNESCHIRVVVWACHVAHVDTLWPLRALRCMGHVTYMSRSCPPWMSHVIGTSSYENVMSHMWIRHNA